ncbi:Ig-like domain-containing domain [Spirosoma koreense]
MAGLLAACRSTEETSISIRWDTNRATALVIPTHFLEPIPPDSLEQWLTVRLAGKETAILGTVKRTDEAVLFEPLVPFTRGLRYGVWLRNNRLQELTIPPLATNDRPTLLAIYPSPDSLPDNLLKLYLRFSRPMREGQSLNYITILRNGKDTLPGVFLDLQPELWNADRTLLTLWLDPGRIKRDLQPNQRLGAPLQLGNRYELLISGAWPDAQGATLGTTTQKRFVAVQRDSLSPSPARWAFQLPPSDSRTALEIRFGEALDYSLLTETLHVLTKAGQPVAGHWQSGDEEKRSWFKPDQPWQAGLYKLRVESRLEDLAGNNLNRPFDRDLTQKSGTATPKVFVERFFRIQK